MECVRCKRGIDSWARICPFCNWNQSTPPPTREFVPEQVANYKPPEETSWRTKVLFAGAGVLLLIAAFLVGMVINSDGAPKNAPQTLEEQAAERNDAGTPRRANTTLIPTNERGGFEAPITSAPSAIAEGGTTSDVQRTDATAVSATEYAVMAKRAQEEKERMAAAVDPRSITGSPYVAPPPRKTLPPPMTSASSHEGNSTRRTRPILEYRPLPPMSARGSARLRLLVGADGRVRDVDIERPLAGNTAQLLAAVQRWRFKPATENGTPVAAPYSVEISFKQ
jgi:TonB family protein